MTNTAYTVTGTTDSVTTCDCCGRKNLKSTVAMVDNATQDEVFFGVSCAARAARWTVKEIKTAVAAADRAAQEAARAAMCAKHDARQAAWMAHLNRATGSTNRTDIFAMVTELGGIAAAKVGFAW